MTTQNGSAGPLHQREICSSVVSLKFAAYSPLAASLAPQANRRCFDCAALRMTNLCYELKTRHPRSRSCLHETADQVQSDLAGDLWHGWSIDRSVCLSVPDGQCPRRGYRSGQADDGQRAICPRLYLRAPLAAVATESQAPRALPS